MGLAAVNEVGNRYGRLLVIKRAGSGPDRHAMWLCQCNCGNVVATKGARLRYGKAKSCGCSWKRPRGEAAANMLLSQYRRSARNRGHVFDLDTEYFRLLTSSQCYYCGGLPIQTAHQGKMNGAYTHNGIDRINNKLGYTKENCVPCCKICNHAKATLTADEFITWIRRAATHLGGASA